jgi:carboxyl-terminal processing protease
MPHAMNYRRRSFIATCSAFTIGMMLSLIPARSWGDTGGNQPIAPTGGGVTYDLSQALIFSKVLYYVNSQYYDQTRTNPRRMLLGALDYLQREIPEILVEHLPERDPKVVRVHVGSQDKLFSIERVDTPWTLRSTAKEIFKFIQPNLSPVPPEDSNRRLVNIEISASNGMLYTLDPHSVLLDVDAFKDMRTAPAGATGGTGLVIETDHPSGRILIKKPMADTPAMRAGLKPGDHIARIGNESTANMTLQEVVNRLRGGVGAPVDIYVERAGLSTPRKFTIRRDYIRPPAIDPPANILVAPVVGAKAGAKIGYLRLVSFTFNADVEVAKALAFFEREKVNGIVLDLRANPGGLYDQAKKVADAFIGSGVIVSMVGAGGTGARRKDEMATGHGNTKIPLAVLVSHKSASATEIVAAAIKSLDRGIVIGETTFGMGSVQMLFDIPSPVFSGKFGERESLGLKLTTAQFLTPGDVSIQNVGVTPDIQLDKMRVEKRGDQARVNLQPSTHRRKESDYVWRLENPTAQQGGRPLDTLSYLYVPPSNKDQGHVDSEDDQAPNIDEPETDDFDDATIDYPIEFARDLVAQVKSARRQDLLTESKQLLGRARAEQDRNLQAAMKKLGIDWSQAPESSDASVETSLTIVGGDDKVKAGQTIQLRGTVKNLGTTTVYRARAVLHCDNLLFDESEMVFGKIAPGATKTYDLAIKMPRYSLTRTDIIRAQFFGQGKLRASGAEMTLNIEGKPRPLFAYAYQTIDDVGGNRDGRVQRGERVRTLVRVKNIGTGAALRTQATVRNGAGQDGILITAGRFETNDLAPGETKDFSFVYEVTDDFKPDEYKLELTIADAVLGESVSDIIKVKISPPDAETLAPDKVSLTVRQADVALREAPEADGLVLGYPNPGSVFSGTGKIGDYYRVDIEPGRQAFVAMSDVTRGGRGRPSYLPAWHTTPPILSVSAPTVVTGPVVHIKGSATDNTEIKYVYVQVWNRESKLPPKKVFYLPNRGDKTHLAFETDVPLWPGSNLIQVFAHQGGQIQSTQNLAVFRRTSSSTDEARPASR